MNLLFAAVSALCTGVDGFITKKRVEKYGVMIEVNPLVRQIMEDFGKNTGIVFNLGLNAAILAVLWGKHWHDALAVFTGMKLGLLILQIKSLQVETYIENVLAGVRARAKAAEARVVTAVKTDIQDIKNKL